MGYSYDYLYEYPTEYYNVPDSIFGAIMSILMIVIAVGVIFWLISYVFHAVGLYTIAKRMGMAYPWLAFIPFARAYLQGEAAGVIGLKSRPIRNPGIWKLVLPIISGVVFSLFYSIILGVAGIGTALSYGVHYGAAMGVGTIMMILVFSIIFMIAAVLYEALYQVLCVLINIQIFGRFTSRNMAVAHAVLSAVVPLYESICFFVMRNKAFNPGMEPQITPPPVRPVYPVNPGSPVQSETPVQNEAPVQPEAAVQKETPVQPETPVQSEVPVQPEAPVRNETGTTGETQDGSVPRSE